MKLNGRFNFDNWYIQRFLKRGELKNSPNWTFLIQLVIYYKVWIKKKTLE